MSKYLIIAPLLILSSCLIKVDDQRSLPKEREVLVNPTPIQKSALISNNRHKVLVGVIDTGADYNHPFLKDKIHYDLGPNDEIIGAGYDFIGDDRLPSPYLGRSFDYNTKILPVIREDSLETIERIKQILVFSPKLSNIISPLRLPIKEELSGAWHGTHVSGLASFDIPEIGVVPFRVSPVNTVTSDEGEHKAEPYTATLHHIKRAIILAHKKGVRILNLSLGIFADGDNEQMWNTVLKLRKDFIQFMKEYPDMLVIAAAGNMNGMIIDNKTIIQVPCGVPLPNILCVGSLDADNQVSSFSNLITTPGTSFIFARGSKIVSTFPTKMCSRNPLIKGLTKEKAESSEFALKLEKKCLTKKIRLHQASGTSMATPLVVREAAKIKLQYPNLTPVEIIKRLLEKGKSFSKKHPHWKKLKVDLPKWAKN